jgi:MoaA/NifB/PqqE/SkfB family radical SAM enzyme
MTQNIQNHLHHVLKHLYINPLEKCNLKCKICYTRKTGPILSKEAILSFIERYENSHTLETITFCGGEVFALAYFPSLLNTLTDEGKFVQVITNGTIDVLDQFTTPNLINLIVSLDGLPEYHDKNRGEGNFQKSLSFMKKAHHLGFHLDVFSIITKQNMPHIDEFEKHLKDKLGFLPVVTYHPRKPPMYLTHHPISNIVGETDGFDFLDKKDMIRLMQTRNVFPPKDLGCYQIAVASDGKVYGCCEGTIPIGRMDESIDHLTDQLSKRLELWDAENTSTTCLGCSQHDFVCGIKEYLNIMKGN